jgi:uncharacterized protein YfiM (DUF2279 family)
VGNSWQQFCEKIAAKHAVVCLSAAGIISDYLQISSFPDDRQTENFFFLSLSLSRQLDIHSSPAAACSWITWKIGCQILAIWI